MNHLLGKSSEVSSRHPSLGDFFLYKMTSHHLMGVVVQVLHPSACLCPQDCGWMMFPMKRLSCHAAPSPMGREKHVMERIRQAESFTLRAE